MGGIKAILVRVTTDVLFRGAPAAALWIVATSDPTSAFETVRKQVPSNYRIEVTDASVSDEVVERLQLAPGQAVHL